MSFVRYGSPKPLLKSDKKKNNNRKTEKEGRIFSKINLNNFQLSFPVKKKIIYKLLTNHPIKTPNQRKRTNKEEGYLHKYILLLMMIVTIYDI